MPSKMAGKKESSSSPPPSVSSDGCSNSTRLQRNLAEKQRRDKLNGFITELATIVPMVSMASKRLDKTSILRLSAAHLRISQSFLGSNRKKSKRSFKWRPSFFTNEQMREILECVEGFLLVTTSNGKIMYVSSSVEKFLGHQNLEMIGHSIVSFVHPSDSEMVREQLKTLTSAAMENGGSKGKSARCSFYCRLREKSQPRSEVLTYQFVHIVGHMAATSEENDSEMEDQDQNESVSSKASSSSSCAPLNPVLKAFARVVHSNPYNELSLTDMIEDEYVTRHSPDGTIVFSDHRLSTITGHLPHEVYGLSAYEYILQEDIPVALFAHRLMFSNEGGTGMIVYRLRMRNEGCVYLKTTGYLQFVKSGGQIDHFVCVNKQLNDEEGEKELKRFVERFTPHIQETCTTALYESIKNMKCLPTTEIKTEKPELDESVDSVSMDVCSGGPSNTSDEVKTKGSGHPKAKSVAGDLVTGVCSKNLYNKISLETELSGPMMSSYSPLTESSLSANSPQSEDTCIPSPMSSAADHIDVTYSVQDTSSSSSVEVPSDLVAILQNGDVVCNSLSSYCLNSASQTFQTVDNNYSAESNIEAGVFVQGNIDTPSPASSASVGDIAAISERLWSKSVVCDGYLNRVIPTPPSSSVEENGESPNARC